MIRRLFLPKWKREFHKRVDATYPAFGQGVDRYVQGVEQEWKRRFGK